MFSRAAKESRCLISIKLKKEIVVHKKIIIIYLCYILRLLILRALYSFVSDEPTQYCYMRVMDVISECVRARLRVSYNSPAA